MEAHMALGRHGLRFPWTFLVSSVVALAAVAALGRWVSEGNRSETTSPVPLALAVAGLGSAHAQSPPLDSSPGYFAGEWGGTGDGGSYCHVQLSADGRGWVLIDGGSGDWLAARIQWRNRQQALQVEKIVPVPASSERRVMPLAKFTVASGFNQSFSLQWSERPPCHLQKIETMARHLVRARSAIEGLPPGEGKR
jgi:hypothetical protein